MGDHYLPKYYLKGFCDSRGHIYQYEKGLPKAIRTSPKNIAQENKLYPPELEKYLNARIEQPAGEILDKIRNRLKISGTEKNTFSEYIVVMVVRVPDKREVIKEWFEDVKGPYFDKLQSDLNKMRTSWPEKKDIVEKRLSELNEILDKDIIFPKEIWHRIIDPTKFPRILWAIRNMTWNFLVSNNLSFLAGDNPVSYFVDIGLKDNRAELCFPISKNVTLLAGWQNKRDCQYITANANDVHEINRRTTAFAVRYVFHPRDEEWIIKLVNKTNLR